MRTILFITSLFVASSAIASTSSVSKLTPEAAFCKEVGGNPISTIESNKAKVGLCKIGDAVIEQTTLLRAAKQKIPTLASRSFNMYGGDKLVESAQELCSMLSGVTISVKTKAKKPKTFLLCTWDDESGRSAIEMDTLYQGPKVHTELAELIKE